MKQSVYSLWPFNVCHTVIVIKSTCCQYVLAESLALHSSTNLFPSATHASNTDTYRTFGEQRRNVCLPLSLSVPHSLNKQGFRTLQLSKMQLKKSFF